MFVYPRIFYNYKCMKYNGSELMYNYHIIIDIIVVLGTVRVSELSVTCRVGISKK
jgi:hypothetical protein